MEITLLGHSSFRIKGKTATVVTDPFDGTMVGLKYPRHVTSDIVSVSHDHTDHNAVSQIEGNPYIVNGVGEYDVKGVSIIGVSSYHDNQKGTARGKNIIYRLEIDGLALVHLGDLGHELYAKELEVIDGADVLFVPVGGFYTIDAQTAVKVIKSIDPYIVIPMHYSRPELNQANFSSLAPLSAFLSEIGKTDITSQAKLTITKDKLPEGELQVVVLE